MFRAIRALQFWAEILGNLGSLEGILIDEIHISSTFYSASSIISKLPLTCDALDIYLARSANFLTPGRVE